MNTCLVNIDYECDGIKGQTSCTVLLPKEKEKYEAAIHAQIKDKLFETLQYDAEDLFQNRSDKRIEREQFFGKLVNKTKYTWEIELQFKGNSY